MSTPRFVIFALVFTCYTFSLRAQVTLTDSDIPIVVINTFGLPIPNEPKITAEMGVIYNGPGVRNYITDPFNNYNGNIGIELRGGSSLLYHPKKSYGFELWDSAGIERDTTLLGMPSESDWCLIANYIDKSLMNNSLTYSLWQQMGHWGPRHQNVELVINGEYQGVYLLTEKIKRDSARVGISKLLAVDTTGDELTGGYIVAIDQAAGSACWGWDSQYDAIGAMGAGVYPHFNCVYPDSNSLMPQQGAYIKSVVDSFETAVITGMNDPVTGWQKFADIHSFVDYFLIQEFSKNVDGYRASTYFYKDKQSKGGKLKMLVWDYDRGWGNASYATGSNPSGWDYPFGDNYPIANPLQVPRWWDMFLKDTLFTKALRCRWEELRYSTLGITHLHDYADSMAAYLNESQARNFTEWPILGVLIFPNPAPVPTTYAGEITELKNWITNRWNWLDANIPGIAVDCTPVVAHDAPSENRGFAVYPNPCDGRFNIQPISPTSGTVQLEITDLTGRTILHYDYMPFSSPTEISISGCPAGIYFIRVMDGKDTFGKKVVVE